LNINTLSSGNGAFTIGKALKQKDFTDGLSNTVFFSERDKGDLKIASKEIPTQFDFSSSASTSVPRALDMSTGPKYAAAIDSRYDGTIANAGPISNSAMFQGCGSYIPTTAQIYDFTAPGRWDDTAASQGPGATTSYTDGWPVGTYMSTMYNHVAPPNWSGFDCGTFSSLPDTPGETAIVSARSSHAGIVNTVFGDGHGSAINSNIDGYVWRALGTRNGQDANFQFNPSEASPSY
jgi:hypothetical protein